MSAAQKGRLISIEHRKNIAKALKGKKLPESVRMKISEAGKEAWKARRVKMAEAGFGSFNPMQTSPVT